MALCAAPLLGARLVHNDGTVVQGRIVNETPDDVRIETTYGVLTYQKSDLATIERDTAAPVVQRQTTAPMDLSPLLPAGPINPMSPPSPPPLVYLGAQQITADMYRNGVRPVITPPPAPAAAAAQTTQSAPVAPGAAGAVPAAAPTPAVGSEAGI